MGSVFVVEVAGLSLASDDTAFDEVDVLSVEVKCTRGAGNAGGIADNDELDSKILIFSFKLSVLCRRGIAGGLKVGCDDCTGENGEENLGVDDC